MTGVVTGRRISYSSDFKTLDFDTKCPPSAIFTAFINPKREPESVSDLFKECMLPTLFEENLHVLGEKHITEFCRFLFSNMSTWNLSAPLPIALSVKGFSSPILSDEYSKCPGTYTPADEFWPETHHKVGQSFSIAITPPRAGIKRLRPTYAAPKEMQIGFFLDRIGPAIDALLKERPQERGAIHAGKDFKVALKPQLVPSKIEPEVPAILKRYMKPIPEDKDG